MRVASIADKSRPDYWPRRIKAIEDQIAAQRTARSLQSAEIGAGGITVQGGAIILQDNRGSTVASLDQGGIHVNPGAGKTSIALQIGTDSGNPAGELLFMSSHGDPAAPARVLLQDGSGAGFPALVLASQQATNGQNTSVQVAPDSLWLYANAPSSSGNYASVGLTPTGLSVTTSGLNGDTADFVMRGTGVGATLDMGNVSLQANQAPELRVLAPGGTTYLPCRASSFPTGSSREIKQDVEPIPFDSVAAVEAAPAQQWSYRPEFADEHGLRHIGPFAEDLPADLVTTTDGIKGVDLLSLVGVLWDAVGKLSARVSALEAAQTTTGATTEVAAPAGQ